MSDSERENPKEGMKDKTLGEPLENHKIFLGYSLVYLLPFLYIIFLPFFILFVSFLCLPDL